jgi:hypothetical protein
MPTLFSIFGLRFQKRLILMKVVKVWFSEDSIFLESDNGEVMNAGLWRFPRLKQASEEQRKDWEQFYDELRWESIDEDIGTHNITTQQLLLAYK